MSGPGEPASVEGLRELLAKARHKPWKTAAYGGRSALIRNRKGQYVCTCDNERDAALIVAAVNALPALLDKAEEVCAMPKSPEGGETAVERLTRFVNGEKLAGVWSRPVPHDRLRDDIATLLPPQTPTAGEGLRELLAKATPGEWSHEGEDSEAGFHVEAIYGPDGKRLFDAHNSTAMSLVEEYGGDEHGDWHDVWDEVSRNNAALIVAAVNALPALLDIAEETGRLREALVSIAANTCCGSCQEAALVARSALSPKEKNDAE